MAPSPRGWGGRPAGGLWEPSVAWGACRAYLLSTWLVAWFKASLRMEFSCCKRASCALGREPGSNRCLTFWLLGEVT